MSPKRPAGGGGDEGGGGSTLWAVPPPPPTHNKEHLMEHTPNRVQVNFDEQRVKNLMWRVLADAWAVGYWAGRNDEANNGTLADSTPNPFVQKET